MILELKQELNSELTNQMCEAHQGFYLRDGENHVIVTSSKLKEIAPGFEGHVKKMHLFSDDIQLASNEYLESKREISFGEFSLGGQTDNCAVITGPCSVESKEQIFKVAEMINSKGLKFIRGGCFKPRTSPYSFQGMGKEGLRLLEEVREKFDLKTVTEVKDASHVNEVIESADIVQIGAKAMYDQGILKACSKTHKPILLKRGFGSTLQELVQAAEFILSGGNPNVILCERGIRTFENKTRFTLDLCGASYLKHHTNLPIVLDPSHAMGYRYGVPELSKACFVMGVDGLLIESHPTPDKALSDAAQQIELDTFESLLKQLKSLSQVTGNKII